MRKRRVGVRSGTCLCAVVWLAFAASVGAQEAATGGAPTSAREQARVLYEAGAAAFDAGDYGAAREKLQESYELFASLRTLYSLGLCQQALGDFGPAVRSLEQYLREAGAEAPAELRARAEELLGQMRAQLGRLEVRVNADGAAILVDGTVVGRSPLAGPVDVGPGWHIVEAEREGWEGEPQRVNVATGATASVALMLQELPPPAPVAPVPPPPAESYAVPQYGPPPGASEKDWYGISDSDYQEYVFSTGRHQPLANWILERNRENPDLDLGVIVAGSQGPAWLLAGTLVYILHEDDKYDHGNGTWDMPWMSFFTWLLGSALTTGAIIMLVVDALDIGEVAVAHPERLTSVPAGASGPPAPAPASAPAAAEAAIPVEVSFGIGGLVLRF